MADKVPVTVRQDAAIQVRSMLLNEASKPADQRDALDLFAQRVVHNVIAVLIQEGVL